MGMDVFGKHPSSETGKYFRNNIWWWHPLWTFCESVAEDLIPSDNAGHWNEGWGLCEAKAIALAGRLEELLESGTVKSYEEVRNKALAAMPEESCRICDGTGTRQSAAGSSPCNTCEGTGKVKPWVTHYPFSEDNVREFAAFLRDCGGFEIC
ncbi:MAG: hypothetical protein HC933_19630 [Pleurocapsa sp. SU_196_0]|nr:hypothetical protein [Pleurocapsa sp. SU_196_0]